MDEQLSFDEAKRLSIIKWQAHVDAGGCAKTLPNELDNIHCACGFCERHQDDKGWHDCTYCELALVDQPCIKRTSLFGKWSEKESKENAQALLDCIKQLKKEKS